VLEDVDMDVVGLRFVGLWAEHGREPAASRFADRIYCSAGIAWICVRSDGECRAVREFESQNICRNSERVGEHHPSIRDIPLDELSKMVTEWLQARNTFHRPHLSLACASRRFCGT
jgi:hypothetical protein